jgi:UDPglucose 6-dehydrogenase
VVGCDPRAASNAKEDLPELELAGDAYEAASGAHALVVATDWPAFRDLDLRTLKEVMLTPLIVDGRNLFDPARMAEVGFWYYPTGRPPVVPDPAAPSPRQDEAAGLSPPIEPRTATS